MANYSKESQSIDLEGVGNARELGGYRTEDGRTVRRGVLLRTAAPNNASPNDCRKLRDEFRLSKVLDFRTRFEIAQAASGTPLSIELMLNPPAVEEIPTAIDFATTVHVPILNEDKMVADMEQEMEALGGEVTTLQAIIMGVRMGIVSEYMYVEFLSDDCGKRGFATVFEHLLAQPRDEALLFHCTQGKDRTGLAAMLILNTLGVNDETILFDYLLTNQFNTAIIEREKMGLLHAGIAQEDLDTYMLGMDKVFAATMANAMAYLRKTYGSVWGFVNQELGVSEEDRDALQEKYLD